MGICLSVFLSKDDDHEVAVTSAGPHANHLNCALDGQPCQNLITQFFTGQVILDALPDDQPTV